MRIFVGVDPRSPISYNVLQYSITRRSSIPVSITPLYLNQLPIVRKGLTEFTFSRYLVPWLCNYQGTALFLDSDMLCLGDVAQLFSMKDASSVQVVKHDMRFEWPSLMLFDCAQCDVLTPEYIEKEEPQSMEWGDVGQLPGEWNHLVGYDSPKWAQMIHYTQGIPEFKEVRHCEYAQEWYIERDLMNSSCSWIELMGNSVHMQPVLESLRANQ